MITQSTCNLAHLQVGGDREEAQDFTMTMEQVFRHCDKDTLKMAMLRHEATFRQQVHELHRLYRIQKLLMRDLNRELKSQRNLSTSPNGGSTEHSRGGALAYEHRYAAARGPGGYIAVATPTPRTALNFDVVAPAAVEYVRSAVEEEEDDEAEEETDDDAELELTLAVGGGGAKKRYGGEHPSGGESLSSSSTESDVLTASGREWCQARGTPYQKRRPGAGMEVVQVEDGVGMQAPPPLLFHWLSLKMA
ncbi:hypothetical protein HU200_066013 [Digitaria exilis]|uniref:Uncharacterized protein n=1 Tax=Digitaria exilis TaxID=1010633 RepID=A0A834ZXN5_9POAL|nr:hypothetical protein HU200_066013 [Digitaria exilis]